MGSVPASWSTQQLGSFLSFVGSISGEAEAIDRAVERAAEVLDADVAALVEDERVLTATGFPAGELPAAQIVEASRERLGTVAIRAVGECAAVSAALEPGAQRRLLIARALPRRFAEDEIDLIRGIARVLATGLRTIELLELERSLRRRSERQAAENELLLGALRERQGLLEKLSRLQRAIAGRSGLEEVLELVTEGVADTLDVELVALRLLKPDQRAEARLVSSVGARQSLLGRWREARVVDLFSAPALEQGTMVESGPADAASLGAEFAAEDVRVALAAPLVERGRPVGALAIGSRSSERSFGARDEDVLLAFAEHASLALADARAAEEATHEAFHDSLTGLPNRSLFIDRLDHALARLARGGAAVAVLFCDLDGFKTVNDSLGHAAGDRLLAAVGERLAGSLRPSDTVARFGGDEFAILLESLAEPEGAARAAARVLAELEAPFELAGRDINVGASIGIAAADARSSSDALLRNADLAMYRAKARGKGRYELFEPGMHAEIVRRMELEVDLKRAIAEEELVVHYQPIFDLPSGQIAGLEALVRWDRPGAGLILPSAFIPMAEESGQIRALGRFVLREATRRLALWRARYPAYDWLFVSVNISGLELRETELPSEVEAAIAAAELEPSHLLLEMTETVVMGDTDASMARLEELRELGVRLAVDDFGTGYSSLEYLDRLPIDALKIAKPFVDGIGRDKGIDAIPRAIADLAEIFGLAVIAEGIERPEQAATLEALGCRFGQGNLLSPALDPERADSALFGAGLLGGAAGVPPRDADAETEHRLHRP